MQQRLLGSEPHFVKLRKTLRDGGRIAHGFHRYESDACFVTRLNSEIESIALCEERAVLQHDDVYEPTLRGSIKVGDKIVIVARESDFAAFPGTFQLGDDLLKGVALWPVDRGRSVFLGPNPVNIEGVDIRRA